MSRYLIVIEETPTGYSAHSHEGDVFRRNHERYVANGLVSHVTSLTPVSMSFATIVARRLHVGSSGAGLPSLPVINR